jgi:serine/threonine-protein kinase
MTPDRYGRVRELHDAVIELSVDERTAFFQRESVEGELVAEVMALIVAGEQKSLATISRPLHVALESANQPAIAVGDVLDVWRIEREIGQGGMGSVYLAERCDGHFQQTAAVKFLRGMPSAEMLAYFTRERQLLATLNHANIARLYDGGATKQGRPYLVMEYVDGQHIDAYCEQQRLSVQSVLTLFLQVCDAVAFAHRQLIVHCDLKPSNILIDKRGRPTLLDFGIAHLAENVQGSAAAETTFSASPGFTPRYASPEQRTGGHVSTVSDVYSLGILLGELLALSPDGATSSLRKRERESIVARATVEDSADRYASVDAFAADIQRYLNNEPVVARPATSMYVAQKFLTRRWPLVLLGLGFVATTLVFTVVVLLESQRASKAEASALLERDATKIAQQQAVLERDRAAAERDRATGAENRAETQRRLAQESEVRALRERDRARAAERLAVLEQQRATSAESAARQTSDFLISVFDSSTPNAESGDIPASKLIAAAEARLEKQMQGQPATQAQLYSTLGVVQSNMGRPKDARANLERALGLERKLNRPLVLAEILARLHRVASGTDSAASTEAYAKEALALREQYAPRDSQELAESLAAMGRTVSMLGRREEATQLFTRALAILEDKYPESAKLSETYALYGSHLNRNGEFAKGLDLYHRANKLNAAIYGELHPSYLEVYEWYAYTLTSLRRFDEAEAALKRALRLRKQLHGERNALVAGVMRGLATLLIEVDRPSEAIPLLEEALPVVAQSQGTTTMAYAVLLANLANANSNIGNYAVAEKLNAEAIAIADKVSNKRPPPQLLRNHGRFQMQLGKLEDAGRSLLVAYEARRALFGEKNNATIDSHLSLAEWHILSNQLDEASARLDRVATLVPGASPLDQIAYDRHRAMIAAGRGDFDAALVGLEKVEQARFKLRSDKSALAWLGVMDRAEVLAKRGTPADQQKSAALATQILAVIRPTFDPNSPVIARLIQLQQPRQLQQQR